MRKALLANDWENVSRTMIQAYPNRKRLAPGVTTPQMEMLVEKALANGAERPRFAARAAAAASPFSAQRAESAMSSAHSPKKRAQRSWTGGLIAKA